MAQVTEYVSPYMLLYDDKILHFWKVFLHGCCSFQCYCCFTISECHVPTTNNMPYYTMSVWHVEEYRHIQVRCKLPGHRTECHRVLLHHVSLTCGRMQVYPGQMYIPLLIDPSATELYYTMSVWYVVECRCTQVRCNPIQPLLIEPRATEP